MWPVRCVMGWTVVGEDGRRMVRGVSHAFAQLEAARVSGLTGERFRVVVDDAEGDAAVGDPVAETPAPSSPAPKPRRSRKT